MSQNISYQVISQSLKETMALGARLASYLKAGDLVALVGVFGAGKTYFTKGIAQGLGVKKINEVISPTFILCNIYKGKRLFLYHFDAQRLPDAKEFLKLGLPESVSNGVGVLEWADKWPGFTGQPNTFRVKFELKGKNKRWLEFRGNDKRWVRVIKQLRKECSVK